MAQIVGKNGSIRTSGGAIPLDNWTLSRSRDTHDATVYGSSFRTFVLGLKTWTLSAGGVLDSTNAQQLAVRDQLEDGTTASISIDLRLGGTTNKRYSGEVYITGDTIAHNVGDTVKWTFTGQGTGALAFST